MPPHHVQIVAVKKFVAMPVLPTLRALCTREQFKRYRCTGQKARVGYGNGGNRTQGANHSGGKNPPPARWPRPVGRGSPMPVLADAPHTRPAPHTGGGNGGNPPESQSSPAAWSPPPPCAWPTGHPARRTLRGREGAQRFRGRQGPPPARSSGLPGILGGFRWGGYLGVWLLWGASK